MTFLKSKLFWKMMVPFSALSLVFIGALFNLGVPWKMLALFGGFSTVLATQIWFSYQAALGKPLQALTAALESADKKLLEKSLNSSGDKNQSELSALKKALKNNLGSSQDQSGDLANHAEDMVRTSEELCTLIQGASHSMDQQLQQTDMVATAVTEMANSVKTVAENAQAASERSIDAVSSSNNGQQVITETVSAIDRVSTEMNNAKSVVQNLNKDSENIGAVLDVIKGIAEQTNLLALNAAIEAARAGEQGRGFAVVADEVRTLASKTQESTREIEAMIESLQAGAGQAVGVIEQGVSSTASTVKQAGEANKAISEIVEAVQVAKQMSEHISHAAREQKGVTEEMNRNILTIADTSKDSAQYTKQIAENADRLSKLANQFKTLSITNQ